MRLTCMTDKGLARDINEDSCFYCKYGNGWNLLIVADGMGGHNAGEVASSIAVRTISEYMGSRMEYAIDDINIEYILKDAILKANTDIYEESLEDVNCSGMGTTVTAAVLSSSCMVIGHVGDSRAYIYKNGGLNKLTSDHSLVAELVKNGTITEDEAEHHPQKNVITRALGAKESVNIDIERVYITEGDTVLLCSDGLSNMLPDKEIEKIMEKGEDIENTAHNLIDEANSLGGYDNITVAIAEVTRPDGEVKL